MTRYATTAQARADAESLGIPAHLGIVPLLLLSPIEGIVLDPRSNSDTLLIVADALRDAITPFASVEVARALRQLADTLTHIAPTRANAIAEPAPATPSEAV